MNLVLVNNGYGVASISPVLRKDYIDSLSMARKGKNPDKEPFIKLIAECVIETQRDYCRLLRISLSNEKEIKNKIEDEDVFIKKR
jgi:hypothetical protein